MNETTTTTAPVRYCRGSSAPCRCATCRLAEQRAAERGEPQPVSDAYRFDLPPSPYRVWHGIIPPPADDARAGVVTTISPNTLADFPQSGAENTPAREKSATELSEISGKFAGIGLEIGELVETKQRAYGDSYGRSGDVMLVLYPDGIRPDQYDDALAVVRVVDKLFRIATDRDALGESPWRDVAGYGILGAARVERKP